MKYLKLLIFFGIISLGHCHFEFLKHLQSLEISPTYKCLGCKTAVEALKYVYERNATQDKIIYFAKFICQKFTSNTNIVCKGMTSQFREEFLYVVEKLLVSPDLLCGLFIDECGDPKNPFNGNWEIKLPPKYEKEKSEMLKSNKIPKTQATIFKVLQLSDLHFDLLYKPDSEVDCNEPICCHDIHKINKRRKRIKKVKKPAGYWGSVGNCDLPFWTIDAIFEDISKNHEDIEYIMLSGDYMSHNDWNYTKEEHLFIVGNLSSMIQKYFPKTPVFWAIGNHEGVPVNSFAPHTLPEKYRPQWIYKAIKDAAGEWLPREVYGDFEYRGSWAVMVQENLKLITINTGYCETTNFWLYLNQTDPDESLSWLVNQLYDSEKKGIYVHILAHIPPGDGECLEGWSRNYYRIVNRFSETITGQFFGHIHVDGFTVFYENMNDINSKPTNIMYSSPSITTYSNLNPAYRIYEIENFGSYRIIDHHTYFYDLLTPQSPSIKPHFKLLYSAKSEYSLPDMSPDSWNNLISQIENNPDIYKKFINNYSRNRQFVCDESCKKEALCSLRRGHHNDSKLCKNQLSTSELIVKEGLTSISSIKKVTDNIEPSFMERVISSEVFDNIKQKIFNFFG
ncbi:Sphingomyelin phosphodiesterase [Strongyloides ratti]|uniref:Sphingomyelin phosphodiesterase n=1 Tax=Strongyloides ratti TaxID=34506 RepID=A0A090LE71_STRRB|nr:Sphingomyelin phosphodiesterase [Strongyloides ratti]CEF68052.1 Sphingomyelin phosphodiesterase [Strongyloides ratti]